MPDLGDRWQRPWSALRQMSWRQRWLALQAWLLFPIVALALRATSLKRVLRWLDVGTGNAYGAHGEAVLQYPPDPARVAAIVDAVARRHPSHPSCLARSLTLWWLLRRRRIAADLRVGVRKEGGTLQAHAWVEHRGQVLGESGDVGARFASLGRAGTPGL